MTNISKLNTAFEFHETVTENKIKKISGLINELSKRNIYPALNDRKLIDVIKNDQNRIVDFIKNNSILFYTEDIKNVLKAKCDYIINNKKGLVDVYDAIFSGKSNLDKVTIFSGGTGSNKLTKGLLEIGGYPILILNAYDDGKSTGDIRRNFNLLGPSDIAKNIIILLNDKKKELKRFLEYRLPKTESPEKLRKYILETIENTEKHNPISEILNQVDTKSRKYIIMFLREFNEFISSWEKNKRKIYDLRDYGIRNIFYIGAYIYYKKDYHYINKKLIELFEMSGEIILNNQDPLWLIAVTNNGNLLNSETSIINDLLNEDINEVFLVNEILDKNKVKKFYSFKDLDKKIKYIKKFAIYPKATKDVIDTIKNSELIVFAPTTFHSSLAPTLITKGISKALSNSNALKISVANLIKERGHKTVGEILIEMEKYINYEINQNNNIDYLIVNTHGNRTDGVVNANRIPIDKKQIFEQGVEIVEVNIEDSKNQGKHKQRLIAQIIGSLKEINDLGYALINGKLTKKGEINIFEKKRNQIREILSNPILYDSKAKKLESLVAEILEIGEIKKFKPKRPIKVIILGAGKGTRLKADIPKIIYPINGKANLSYLLDKYSIIDNEPIVVINGRDEDKIKNWFKTNPKYRAKIFISNDIRGTAMTLLDVIKNELMEFKGDIILSWGDITNIKLGTIQLSSALHQAMEVSSMTIPTSWERRPYAGLTRDEKGRVNGIFLTKEHPEQKRDFGEHDSSVFIFRLYDIKKVLNQLVKESWIENGKTDELNFLKTIPLLVSNNKEIIGIANTDPRECIGFNTLEEAKLVEKYMKEFQDGVNIKKDMNFDIEKIPIKNINEKDIVERNSKKIKEYLKISYSGILVDIDETITDKDGNIPEDIIESLIEIVNKGICFGIVTGRTNRSLTKKIVYKLDTHPKLIKSSKGRIYIYPENAAYCYRLDNPNKILYEKIIPSYILETATKLLRENILGFRDDYSVTNHKIHIWPKDLSNQKQFVRKMNNMFKKIDLPLIAYKSSSDSILISKIGVDKSVAVENFTKNNNISINSTVKIADMADSDSLDNSMLQGNGSFSVSEIDPSKEDQTSIPLFKGSSYMGVEGSRWLLKNLKWRFKK